MFCSKCGKELSETSMFCSYCGVSVNHSISQQKDSISKSNASKEDELNSLQTAKRYISVVAPYYAKRNECNNKIVKLNKELGKGITGFIVLGVIMGVLAIICLFQAISGFSDKSMFAGLSHAIAGFQLFLFIVFAIVSVLSFALFIPKRKNNAEKMRAEIVDINNQIEKINLEIEQLHNNESVRQDMSVYNKLFPQGNFTLSDIDFIINLMISGRADSIKEGLNLYDEHMHRQKMEQMSQEQTIYAQQTASSAAQTAHTVNEINRKINY